MFNWDINFLFFMRVVYFISFVTSVHSSFKSETMSEVYVNNVATSYFYLSIFWLNIFTVYPISLERGYISNVTVNFLSCQPGN